MPDILSNEAAAAWTSVIVSVIIACLGIWNSDRKRNNLLKDIEVYNAWLDNGKDEVLAKLYYRIEDQLDTILEPHFVTPVFVVQMLWGLAMIALGFFYLHYHPGYTVPFISLGIIAIAVCWLFRILDRTRDEMKDLNKLYEWRRRKAAKHNGEAMNRYARHDVASVMTAVSFILSIRVMRPNHYDTMSRDRICFTT